jgi:hypothetical protein
MTTHALVVKSLLQIEPEPWTMASGTTDVLIPFLKFTFVQDVFPVFVDVMTILAGQASFDMFVVREGHRRSCFPFQYNLVRLRSEGGSG